MAAPAEETADVTARRMHVHDLYRRCEIENVMRDGHRGFVDHFRRHWVVRIDGTGRLVCRCTDIETGKVLDVDALSVSTEALRVYVPDLKQHRDFHDAAPFILDDTVANRFFLKSIGVDIIRPGKINPNSTRIPPITLTTDVWVTAVARYLRMVKRSLADRYAGSDPGGVWKVSHPNAGQHGVAALIIPCLNVPGMLFLFYGRIPNTAERDRVQRIVFDTPNMRPGTQMLPSTQLAIVEALRRLTEARVFPMYFDVASLRNGSAQLSCDLGGKGQLLKLPVLGVFSRDRVPKHTGNAPENTDNYMGAPPMHGLFTLN